MNKVEYEEEVALIKEQNDTEFEIYPMAVEIIQPTIKSLSKRYVFARRKSAKGQIYYGMSSFPDVAILDKDFKNVSNETISKEDWLKLKGCLEVKALGAELISEKKIKSVWSEKTKNESLNQDIGQLIGEILWYKKVLYTNGIEWRYLYISKYTEKLKENIITIVNKRIEFEAKYPKEEFDWWKSFRDIDFEIVDECITQNCIENWEVFIDKINQINWE